MNLSDLSIKNKIVIVAINETKYWKDDLQAKAKRIDCLYMVDLTKPTHCCSITLSYPAVALRNVIQNFEAFTEDELMNLENIEGIDGECRYFDEYFTNFTFVKAYNDGETTEEVEDYEASNPSFLTT